MFAQLESITEGLRETGLFSGRKDQQVEPELLFTTRNKLWKQYNASFASI